MTEVNPQDPPIEKTRKVLQDYLDQYPDMRNKIVEHCMILLHSRDIVSIDELYDVALTKKARKKTASRSQRRTENIDTASKWGAKEKQAIQRVVIDHAAKHLLPQDIHDIVRLVIRRDSIKALEDIARLPEVSFDLLAKRVKEFCALPETSIELPASDIIATRVALIHHFISSELDFIGIAKNFIRVSDLNQLVQRTIGPKKGLGRIGGKAAGMLLAHRVLQQTYMKRGKSSPMPIDIPESYYLRADLYHEFLERSGLTNYYNQKYKSIDQIRAEYPVIKELFRNGSIAPYIIKKFRTLLTQIGEGPLIIRSSSLLEDNFGAAFSGKYKSIFLANVGSLKSRVNAFAGAVTEVYASIMGPDPIQYRKERNLLDYNEMMGILIQKVVGRHYGDYFFPLYAGVAFSRNDYRWTPRIRKEDGMIRLVFGLGTRAVDRVSTDYPRIVALTEPTIRPQATTEEVMFYSQRDIDVINLRKETFETVRTHEVLQKSRIDNLDHIVSVVEDGHLQAPVGNLVDPNKQRICITFDKLIKTTPFIATVREVLDILQEAYECPVDIEFACDGEKFYLLQCRPLAKKIELDRVHIPSNVQDYNKLFSADREIQSGLVKDIRYIVYVPAKAYDAIDDLKTKQAIGRTVGELNHKLADDSFILMGPGRWGSNDINMGVRVTYSDISNTKVLIEIATEKGGYVPEVSFGTHFFQDLLEAGIYYLPLYPDEPGNVFNFEFLDESKNLLTKILPNHKQFEPYIRLIEIPVVAHGNRMNLAMDGETNQALAYLESKDK